jgi:hypothetical protein
MYASEMTPADIRACTGGNNDDGFGFGGNGAWWIIILLLFGWGRNGFGGFGGGGGGCGAPCATQADLAAGFNNSAVLSGINGIDSALCQGFNGVNTALLQGFNGVERGFCDISRQISDCCCGTQRAIDGVNYNMAKGFCDLGNVIQSTTRDVIDNQNANSRAILDFLTQDKIATLTAENQSLKFAASQAQQNALITASQEAQTAELIRRLGKDNPVPAYFVPNPNCCYNPIAFNTGCGCGNGFGAA